MGSGGAIITIKGDGIERADVVAAKGGRSVSVCIPCRDEGATIGPIVAAIRRELMSGSGPLVDELVVVDDDSSDDTAAVAAAAGATVAPIAGIDHPYGSGRGKGNALWASLLASRGDVVVWCDGDVTTFDPEWIVRLAAPLLADPGLALVKGAFRRPTADGGGGRTTELVARPLLSLYFPELAALSQPLAGEYAVRRSVVEQLPFVTGWGVEVALLIDISGRHGAGAIAQVDLGERRHRHRPLHDLSVQAAEVMATVLSRTPAGKPFAADDPVLRRADGTTVELALSERPPVVEVVER
ncbi:MAG: glucosyl-3-phosphoglycerate synthase [Acidimicrobiales bacterium]